MKFFGNTVLSTISAVALAYLALQPRPLAAAGAEVVSGPCGVYWNGSIYQGDGHCHATLVSGPGESETIHISFIGNTPWGLTPHEGVITSSGVLDVDTHD